MNRQWPLVGRSEELAVITDATRTPSDHARGIVLSGSAGVGKTRLAREALTRCGGRDTRRHWIIGTATARSVPLGAFADIAGDFGPDPLRRVREVIDALLGAGHDREVIIGVDDAHLLDDLSAFTVHRLAAHRLATVILTIRSREPAPDAITALWKDHHLQRLELQPLSNDEIAELVEHVLGGPVHSMCAQRLWRYTEGNTLYLRHLLDTEVDSGRMTRSSGMWLWDGEPQLSPTLMELLEARLAQVSGAVGDVLDALAVAEPLDVETLAAVADPDALADAEALGLANVDTGVRPAVARLAHPLLGEVRRASSLRLRRMRGEIVTVLARQGSTDPREVVRRAVLAVESDLPPDPDLLGAAASAAMQLMDQRLAENLAGRAVAAGGGHEARITHAMANFWLERPTRAEAILAELAGQANAAVRTRVAIMRATNFVVELGQPTSAVRELDDAVPTDDDAAQATAATLRAMVELVRGNSATAVGMARAALSGSPATDFDSMLLTWVLITGLGDLGRVDEIDEAAEHAYRLAESSDEVSADEFRGWTFGKSTATMAFLQAGAYRVSGCLAKSDATIARVRRQAMVVPFEQAWHGVLTGMSAMSHGALDDARRSLRESLAYLGTDEAGRMMKSFGRCWLATVTAMAGHAAEARHEFDGIQWWALDPDACTFDPERVLAEAWTCSAEGAVVQAISITRYAAELERARNRPAWEVALLQAATQFGDRSTAARLAELVHLVQGPRAPAAAAHAAALEADDGDGLTDASSRYEGFGDCVAGADAAAQAAVVFQRSGSANAAATAAATAHRLAAQCQGARTPALRAVPATHPLTDRQREIVSLAAQGLSNREIADRLTMSIRSVEGHLFRASQRVGANSREQLISILQGRTPTPIAAHGAVGQPAGSG